MPGLRARSTSPSRWRTRAPTDIGEAEAGYGRAEQRMLLEGLLRFLTLRQRQVVRLRFGEELTQQQIGERIGLSQMQVSRILREAVQRLGDVVVSPARVQ